MLRSSLLYDGAVVHEDDPVRHLLGKAHLVGNADHGNVFLGQIHHNVQNFLYHLRVKGGGGLVKENQLLFGTEGAGDGHTLLLSAGEILRITVGLVG